MQKKLYIIGGTMGAGKTTVCQILKNKLQNSVFLDGDWCWDMNPFQVTEETKKMVVDNIVHMLNNFIKCTAFDNVIFCWVMHEQSIIDGIISKLDLSGCDVKVISLICSAEALKIRLQRDVESKLRAPDIIERSIARIPLYEKLNTVKIDVSNITAKEAAEKIIQIQKKRETN